LTLSGHSLKTNADSSSAESAPTCGVTISKMQRHNNINAVIPRELLEGGREGYLRMREGILERTGVSLLNNMASVVNSRLDNKYIRIHISR